MTSVLAYADILLSHLRDPADIECVRTIKQGGNHLLELISDILDLSKIGSGKLQIKKEIVSLPTLLNEVHSLMAVRAEKKLPLILKYEGAIPESIETDRTRLRQILLNLINMRLSLPGGGSVHIMPDFFPSTPCSRSKWRIQGSASPKNNTDGYFSPLCRRTVLRLLGWRAPVWDWRLQSSW
jgi:signal transduction histidine kinase